MTTPIRVLIVDDHATFVRALTLLFSNDPDIALIGSANDGVTAVELAMAEQPDVVLMDINMPGLDGIEATRRIVDAAPHVAVIVLTMFDDDGNVAAAVRAGARGYLLKGARQDDIRRAVRAAHAGDAIFGAAIARRLGAVLDLQRAEVAPSRAFPGLTDRELDVLDALAAGLDNAAIARRLYLSEKTVRNYVSTVFGKIHVQTRSEAIVMAREAGLGKVGLS